MDGIATCTVKDFKYSNLVVYNAEELLKLIKYDIIHYEINECGKLGKSADLREYEINNRFYQ